MGDKTRMRCNNCGSEFDEECIEYYLETDDPESDCIGHCPVCWEKDIAAISIIDPETTRAEARAEALKLAEKQSREWYCAVSNDYDHEPPKWAFDLAQEQEAERAAIIADEPTHGDKDYPEDALHENGNYECICSTCGSHFTGHKRRVLCKACDAILADELKEREVEGPKVCGNCLHGRSTSLDDIRCYKSCPYIATGLHCKACEDWEPCGTSDNPRALIVERKRKEAEV